MHSNLCFCLWALSILSLSLASCPCGRFKTGRLMLPTPCHVQFGGPEDKQVLTTPRRCDLFITAASRRADAYYTFSPNLPLYSDFCFIIGSYGPTYTYPNGQEDMATVIANLYRTYIFDKPLQGIIAPYDRRMSEIMNYVAERGIKRLVISYTTSDVLQNHTMFPHYYSTSTSESFLNKARLQLLYDFSWRRVAIVATDDAFSSKTAANFLSISRQNRSMDVNFPGSFNKDPTVVFEQFKEDDYRIFVGFFPPEESRFIICKAIRAGLTTSKHVWILPGIYDYLWWRDCTCDNTADKFCSCNDCTEEEMRQAIQGMIFIDNSNLQITSINETDDRIEMLQNIFDVTQTNFVDANFVNITEEDRQYLIHSRAPNAYDAVVLWAVTWHAAVLKLLNSTNDSSPICQSIATPLKQSNAGLDIVSQTMTEILENNVYCGVSGYYNYNRKNEGELGQVKVTQFQGDKECTIGNYRNYDSSSETVNCPTLTLVGLNDSNIQFKPLSLSFSNWTDFEFDDETGFSSSCPYRWKSKNGSYCPDCYTAPTDGACHDESCLCYNNIEEWELSLSLLIMIIGIIIAILLLILNFYYRNNKHFKASSPKFTLFIIIGSMAMYLSIGFLAFSFTGNFIIKSESMIEIALPVFCELDKWLFSLGMVTTLSVMLVRNWRLHKIFYNPKIANRSYLSDKILFPIMFLIITPVFLLLVLWSSIDPFEYKKINDAYNCTDIIVDDSITTELVTYTCDSSPGWRGAFILYNLLLSCGLIFFSYQNAKIKTHFSQEGEFAARAVFVIFLFVVPGFVIDLILVILVSDHSLRLFWVRLLFAVAFPSVVLGGLFIPKFIFMAKDKRKIIKLKKRKSLSIDYEDKMKEIMHLRSVLTKRETSITLLQLRSQSSFVSMGANSAILSPASFEGNFSSFAPE